MPQVDKIITYMEKVNRKDFFHCFFQHAALDGRKQNSLVVSFKQEKTRCICHKLEIFVTVWCEVQMLSGLEKWSDELMQKSTLDELMKKKYVR